MTGVQTCALPICFPVTILKSDVDVFDSNGLLDRKFTSEINDEIVRCEHAYLRGERAYAIAKARKKDEILSKEKCRIFYGNSIALTFLVQNSLPTRTTGILLDIFLV